MATFLGLPDYNNSFYDHNNRNYELASELIFVFGSNISGVHGAGGAKDAYSFYHAEWGCGVGPTGQAYAIPTKDKRIQRMSLTDIRPYVENFVEYTLTSGQKFFVTAVGTGLANNSHESMAVMFTGAKNCWFPEVWKPFLS